MIRRTASALLLTSLLAALGTTNSAPAAIGEVSEFSTGITADSNPSKIAEGPEGNLWFTERNPFNGNQIGRLTPSGTVTQFPVLLDSIPQGIAKGSDGNLWFTETNDPECEAGGCRSKVGRITPSGAVTEFKTGITDDSEPWEITAGPDSNLWFTEFNDPSPSDTNKVARITTAGSVTEFPLSTTGQHALTAIATGADGNLWFTEREADTVGRITPAGTITEFAIPTATSQPVAIAAGADGNLWFAQENTKEIGRITPAGTITEFSAGISVEAEPRAIAAGPDGNMWFGQDNGQIGRITPGGAIIECSTGAGSEIEGITAGPEESMWFAESHENRIGRITATGTGLAANCVTPTGPPPSSTTTTATTTTTPSTPHVVILPTAAISFLGSGLAVQRNGAVAVKLACKGEATCAGTLKLTVKGKAVKGKKAKLEEVGSAHFSISAGRTGSVKFKLTAAGRALLGAAHGHLTATMTIHKSSPGPGESAIRTVHLSEAKAKKR